MKIPSRHSKAFCLFSAMVALLGLWFAVGTKPSAGKPGASAPTVRAEGTASSRLGQEEATAEEATEAATPLAHSEEQVQPDFSKIEAFGNWTQRWADADEATKKELRQEGARLARERRGEFKALIVADPKRALETAVPRVIRQDLPPEVVSELEQPVAATGEYIKFLGMPAPGAPAPGRKLEFNTFETKDGAKYQAHVFGEMAPVMWKKQMPLQGVAVDNELAVAENPVRKLETGERIPAGVVVEQTCPVSGETTVAPSAGEVVSEETPTVEIGERIITLCNGSHVQILEDQNRTKLQASGPGGANSFVDNFPGTASRAIGNFRCLYMRVSYPDQTWQPNTEDSAAWDLANTARYYLETSYGKMTTTSVVTPLIMLPHTKAWYYAKDGTYDSLGMIHSDAVTEARKLGYDGNQFDCLIVRVAGGPKLDGASWGGGNRVWLSWDGMDVMNHECGHSLGLNHANSWGTNDGTPYGNGSNGEYGNPFDVMGGGYGFAAQYNTISKRGLGWLPVNNVYEPTASGTYRIYAYDQPRLEEGKRYQLSVLKDGGRRYNVEFHQAIGGSLANSALILYSGVASNAGNILAAVPGTSWGLDIGRTFSDFEADIHFTVVGKNDTTPASLDVVYNRGPFPGNQPPTVSLAASATTISPGDSVTFTATASDPNGDALAYLWEFDDGVAGTNSAVFTRSFASTAQVTGMVTVTDMKGGITRRNVVINVGSHGLQTVGGAITWNGQALANARVACGGKYCYTDADGNYALSGIGTGSQTLSATLNGFTFTPQFTNPLTVVAGTNTANWTAVNSMNFVSLTKIADATEGGSPGTIRLTRTGDLSADLVVRVTGAGGTAAKGTDYTFNPDYEGDLTFTMTVGQSTMDISVPAVDDTTVEGPETVTLQVMSNGTYLTNSGSAVSLTVNDNDSGSPVVSVASADPVAAESPADAASFTFSRTGSTAAALDLFVNWPGTAANGVDYTGLASKVTIPAGQSSTTVSVSPINDGIGEVTEEATASLSATPNNWVRIVRSGNNFTAYRSNDGATWTQAGTATITMNSSVQVGLVLSSENSGAVATAGFDNVNVSGLTGGDIGAIAQPGNTVSASSTYSLRASGGDLYGTADSAHFASVALNGDGEIKARVTSISTNATWIKAGVMIRETSAAGSKNVFMGIGGGSAQYDFQTRATTDGSTSATTGPGINTANASYVCNGIAKTATATISDDDPMVLVSVSVPDAAASEAGQDSGVFLVSRTGGTAAPLKVYYGLSGTALHGTDYQPLNGEVTIPAGATSAPVVITPIDDDLGEPENETVTLSVTSFNGVYSLGAVYSGTLSIQDNDDLPVIAVRPGGFGIEGGGNPVVVFRGIGSGTGNVSVNYTVSGTATSGTDFTALSGTVSVPANGTNDVTVTIPVINDSTPEPTETVIVKITPNAAYRVYNDGTAIAGIYDNDSGDRVRISNWPDAPSENGAVGRFYVSRGTTTGDLTVNYTVSGTATNGSDFTSLPSTVVIPAGQAGADITVTPINDSAVEGTESVTITVVGGSGYGADEPSSATLYIADNETPPVTVGFTAASSVTTEQPGANGQYRDLAVTLSAASTDTVTVEYDSNGGNATGDDVDWAFVDASAGNAVISHGVLTFAPGTTSQNIRVSIKNDGVSEQTETAVIRLFNGRFAALGTNQHTISISDGITPTPVVRFAVAASARSESAGSEPLLMAMLDRPCGATPVTVNYTVGGTATAGSDYVLSPGTLTFTSGEQVKPLPFTILTDALSESPETVIVTLTSPSNAVLGTPAGHTITLSDSNPIASGVWINPAGGSWTATDNWSYGMIANGTDRSADFSTLDISGNVAVSLNGARTLGSLIFGDPYPTGSWTLNAGSGGNLTLDVTTGTPTITVNQQSATLGLPIAGSEGLWKAGYGTLVLSATNLYTGDTTVASNGNGNAANPQLVLGNPSGQAILGDLYIGSAGTGTTVVQTTVANQLSATQTVQFNTNASENGNWNYFNLLGKSQTIAGLNDFAGTGGVVEGMEGELIHTNATLTLAGSGSYTFNGYLRNKAGGSGTGLLSLVKNGSGTQNLYGTRISYTGDTTVNAGTLALKYGDGDWTMSSANKTVASGGTLKVDLSPQTTQYRKTNLGNTVVNSGGVLELYGTVDNVNSHYLISAWNASGSGTIRVTGGGSVANWTGSTNSLAGFTGLLDIQNGRFACNVDTSTTLGGSLDVNVGATSKLDLRSGQFTIDALDGAAGSVVHKSYTGDNITFTIGNANGSGAFAGAMSGTNYNVIKTGTGTETLTGTHTYTGTTTVGNGTLNATGSFSSPMTIQGPATLAVGTGAIGTLTINNTLSLAGSTTMEVSKSGATLTADRVNGVTSLSYGGALVVSNIGPDALANGNSFTLFTATTYTGNFSSITLPSLAAGLYWNTTQLPVNGTLSVQTTPADDPDGDGFNNSIELAYGSNPNSAASQPPQVYSGLRAWWKLNESSGTTADDSTGNPQDGTLLNSAAWASGLAGNSVSLNGTNQSVQTPALNLNSSYGTITGWIKRNGTQVTWAGLFFERGTEASGLSLWSNHELRYHWNTASNTYNFSSGLIVPDNTWTFCAMVVQPNKATLYMQPAGGTMQSAVNNVTHGTAAFSANLYLGQDSFGGRFFKGNIDDVHVYARALSTVEISQVAEEAHPPHSPVFTSSPVVKPAGAEGVAYTGQTLATSASDPDAGDTLTFTKVSGPAWLSVASNGALSGTPGTANAGANSFAVRVTDSTGLLANETLNIAVAFVNDAPAWTSNPVTAAGATEDAAYSANLTSSVSDPDVVAGDVLTFTKLSGPAWLNVATNGALTGTPGNSDVGANSFSVRVTDTAGTSATATVNISVANVNDAPVWASATITKAVGRETIAYAGSLAADASDIDAGDTLTFSKVSGPAWLAVASNGVLSGTPASGDAGANSFTVRVADAAGLNANATLQITVTPFVADGIWTKVTGGAWGGDANWSANTIANGTGKTADFSTLNLTSNTTVSVDGARTIGNLVFGDTSPNRDWILTAGSGGPLTLDVASGTPAITVNNQTATISGALAGSEGFTKAGTGTLVLSGANGYSGDTILNRGVLGLTHSGAGYPIPGNFSASNLNSPDVYATQDNQFAPGAAMFFTGTTGDHVRFELLGTTQTLAGIDNTASSGRGVIQHREQVAPAEVDASSLLVIDGATGSYSFDAYLRNWGGTLALTKNGANTQTLAGGNITYTGATTVSGGILELANVGSFNSAVTVNSSGTLKLTNNTSYGLGGGVPITVTTGGTLLHNGQTNGNDYLTLAGAVTVSGTTTINQASVTNTTGTNKSLFLDGGLKGSGTCTINATNAGNAVVLRNNNSTFSGQLIVNGVANAATNLGSGLGVGGCTTALQNADIQVNGTVEMLAQGIGWAGGAPGDFTMGALSGTGVLTANHTGGGQMRLKAGNTNNSGSFSGVIADGAGDQLLFTKLGSGIQTLAGSNTYTGATAVNAGTLRINGSIANGAVTVASAATLGGSGTIGGAVTVQNGATLAPGAGGIGTLTVNNNVTLAATSTTQIEVSNTAGTATADRVSGITTLTHGGTLVVSNMGPDALVAGNSFTLFSATTRSGTFATVTLPSLSANLVWNTTALYTSGVISVRALPVAVNDLASVPEDGSVSIPVLANDSDGDNDTLAIQSVTQGAHGSVAIVGSSVTYTPASGWNGTDTFNYTATDNHEGTATASVTVTVVSSNGVWTNAAGGSWPTAGNWSGGNIAHGVGKTADFSTLNLSADATVTLDSARTVGTLLFGDTTPSHNWILNVGSGGSLKLATTSGTTTINVVNQGATIGAPLTGTQGLLKTGTGKLVLNGSTANTYSGDTTLSSTGNLVLSKTAGTVAVPNDMIMAATGSRAILSATQSNQFGATSVMRWSGTGDNRFELNGTTQTLAGIDSTGFTTGTFAGIQHHEFAPDAAVGTTSTLVLDVAGSNAYTFGGTNIVLRDYTGGTLALTKNGSGTQTLKGTGITYSGATNVNAGTLVFAPVDADMIASGGTKTIASGATMKVDFSGQSTQYRKTHLYTTAINSGAVLDLYSTTYNVNDWYLINTWTATGSGTIRVTGGGAVSCWTGTSNALSGFTGLLDIQNGQFSGNINAGSTLGGTLDVNVAATGKLDLRSGYFTIDALDGVSGSSVIKSWLGDTVNFTVGNGNGSGTFAGVMSGANYNLIKAGTGTQTLGGANTYSGTTTVNGGTLRVNGSIANGAVTITAAGTLGGTGSIGGSVSNSGTLAPGSGGVGNLTVSNALTLAPGSSVAWEISDWTGSAGTGYDKVTANSLNITATSGSRVTIRPTGLSLANFSESNATFTLVQTSGGITGWSADKFTVDTTGLTGPQGTWSVQQSGFNLLLVYTAVGGGGLTGGASDYNGNGILDSWESVYFGNANPGSNLADDDADHDGRSNLLEFALGTNPLVADSSPIVYDLEALEDGQHLRITVPKNPAATNLTYTVETCGELNDWTDVNTTIETEAGDQLIVRDNFTPTDAPHRFIRLRVEVAP